MGNESSTAQGWDRPSVDKVEWQMVWLLGSMQRSAAACEPSQAAATYADDCLGQVRHGLFIGGMAGAVRHAELRRLGVTHVLCMASYENSREMDCRSFSYLVVSAHDSPTYPVEQHFDQVHDFITRGREAGGVYVHCMAGISRAATAVLVHLMRSERIPLLDAYRQLKAVRPCVHPNEGFWRALLAEERHLLIRDAAGPAEPGRHYVPSPARPAPSARWQPPQQGASGLRGLGDERQCPQPRVLPPMRVGEGGIRQTAAPGGEYDGVCAAPQHRTLRPFGQVPNDAHTNSILV